MTGTITAKGRQRLVLDGNDQTIALVQFFLTGGPSNRTNKKLGYLEVDINVPDPLINIQIAGASVWFQGQRLAFTPQVISSTNILEVVFWSSIAAGDWTLQYS